MSFRFDALDLVEPQPSLVKRLEEHSNLVLAALLLQPKIFRRREGGNSDCHHADYEATAKLLFLASLLEYVPPDGPEGFTSLFETTSLSVAVFDRWFSLRRFEVDQELEILEPRLRECPLPVEPSGRFLVDRWIDIVRQVEGSEPK